MINEAGTIIETKTVSGRVLITIKDADIMTSITLTPAQAREQAAIIAAYANQAEENK